MIKTLVDSAAILAGLEAKTKDAVLKELLAAAQQKGFIAKKAITPMGKKLFEREAIGSTGLGNSVAVPHLKHEDVKMPALVLARAKAPIEWQAIDGRPVSIVFLLVSPSADPEAHLQCLRWISTLARSADFRRFFMDGRDEKQLRDLLREMTPKV